MEFSQKTIEELQYYIYCLFNPITNKIFYIGKGKGNRVFNHVNRIVENNADTEKIRTIKEIQDSGNTVGHYIIRHGIENEHAAYELESTLIDLLTFPHFEHLSEITNAVSGHNSLTKGIMTADEIESYYSAIPISEKDILDKILIININRKYRSGISPYEATRQSWKLNIHRAKQAKYIISEYKGIFRKIYCASEWYKIKDRWAFHGYEVEDTTILNTYINREFTDKKKGTRNPIRYINL